MLGCIQPMSSPMMNKMLGFCCCAAAGTLAITREANSASRPRQTFLVIPMTFPHRWLPEMGRQPAPDDDRVQRSSKQNEAVRADARDAVDGCLIFLFSDQGSAPPRLQVCALSDPGRRR